MSPGVTEEVSKQVGGFMEIMKMQPLSLALVVMNFLLVAFLFYSNSQVLTQRQNALDQIVKWQQGTDNLMASCVSHDVTKMMLDNMQRITETMLTAEQKEIARMQRVIDQERERNTRLQRAIPGMPPDDEIKTLAAVSTIGRPKVTPPEELPCERCGSKPRRGKFKLCFWCMETTVWHAAAAKITATARRKRQAKARGRALKPGAASRGASLGSRWSSRRWS